MKKITFDLDIYSYQIDCAGQVHNAVYVNWMEIGRLKMLEAVGLPLTTLISQGSYPALAQTTIAYKTHTLSERSSMGRDVAFCFGLLLDVNAVSVF
jgi:acyl-CoA thioesterase FadM